LGYLAIGCAFGFLIADAGYPWWLALIMSAIMYAGAGQYIAVGLFAAGAGLWEAALVQFVVNARHIAYGLSMMNQFGNAGPLKFYLIFGLTDETFALLSSLPKEESPEERTRLMFLITLLNHSYWVLGSVIGAAAGSLIPFSAGGIGYALTALFIVLMIEQIDRIRKPGLFIASAIPAILCVLFLPSRLSLLAALALSLAFSSIFSKIKLSKIILSKKYEA
jgi:4-azaleucine resistance transporter AzlC